MPESACASFCVIEHLNLIPSYLLIVRNHHLRYALAVINDKRLLRQVDENHTNLTPIVGIDGARRV